MQPIEHNGYKVYFKFFCVKSDNKGANEMITRIPLCFKSAACKFCTTHYKNLKDDKREHVPRSLPNGHAFEGCEFFTAMLYAPDIFHDICEGKSSLLLLISFFF